MMESLGTEAAAGPAMGVAFEAFLNPMELMMARRFVGDLAPEDPQEEVHAWHLAASHLLAAQRIGKSRQDGLSERAEQIEVGLAVRLMALADRKSASLDRHRAFRLKAADEAEQRARARAYREADEKERASREQAREAQTAAAVAGREGEIAARIAELQARRDARAQAARERHEGRGAAGAEPAEAPSAPPPNGEETVHGSLLGAGPELAPGAGPRQFPERTPLTRQQRRALARREKKAARRAAGLA